MIRHAGLIALRIGGFWQGALIEGPSGSGKSDLALRSLREGLSLVADDRVLLWTSGGALYGRAPDPLAGLLESRGLGVLATSALPLARVVLAIRCEASAEAVERYPADDTLDCLGARLPVRALWPFDPAGPSKLRRALEHLGQAR